MNLLPLDFAAILPHICNVTGLPEIMLGDDGCCELFVDESFSVNIGYNEKTRQLVLFSTVGDVEGHSSCATEVFKTLLQANRFWLETGGATLSLDSAGMRVILAYRESIYLETVDSLSQILAHFINLTDLWTWRLKELPVDKTVKADDMAAGQFSPMLKV